MRARMLKVSIAGAAVGLMAASAPAAQATDVKVCNEASKPPKGDLVVSVPDTKKPPARYFTDRKAIANGKVNNGVLTAANRSPALALCGPATTPPSTDGGGGGGTTTSTSTGGATGGTTGGTTDGPTLGDGGIT